MANASAPAERETVIARDFGAQLERAFREEVRRGVTTVGPHRDDITLVLGRVPVGAYGSRGQQRLTVLALKLAEVDLMQELTGEWPVLLLDDLASELDPAHRRFVLETAPAEGKQVLVTATIARCWTCRRSPVCRGSAPSMASSSLTTL